MSDEELTNEIVDKLYAAFGTDTGAIFGIRNRGIVAAIVSSTIEYIREKQEQEQEVRT